MYYCNRVDCWWETCTPCVPTCSAPFIVPFHYCKYQWVVLIRVFKKNAHGKSCLFLIFLSRRDMQRYHTLLAGASWMAEYGNPDTDDWQFLKQYSPYHSKWNTKVYLEKKLNSKYLSFTLPLCQDIDPDANYPPILVTTSTRDDRVHPGHARKFVKVRSSTMQRVPTSIC